MILDLPAGPPAGEFDPTVATYSDRGDCIFCYISNECGFADRINPDLTSTGRARRRTRASVLMADR
jgi:hypothetical protein